MPPEGGSLNSTELPMCRKCREGSLLPLSDYGKDGAPIAYKAWVCSNPTADSTAHRQRRDQFRAVRGTVSQ
jgi:hypothetical protein